MKIQQNNRFCCPKLSIKPNLLKLWRLKNLVTLFPQNCSKPPLFVFIVNWLAEKKRLNEIKMAYVNDLIYSLQIEQTITLLLVRIINELYYVISLSIVVPRFFAIYLFLFFSFKSERWYENFNSGYISFH